MWEIKLIQHNLLNLDTLENKSKNLHQQEKHFLCISLTNDLLLLLFRNIRMYGGVTTIMENIFYRLFNWFYYFLYIEQFYDSGQNCRKKGLGQVMYRRVRIWKINRRIDGHIILIGGLVTPYPNSNSKLSFIALNLWEANS